VTEEALGVTNSLINCFTLSALARIVSGSCHKIFWRAQKFEFVLAAKRERRRIGGTSC
jgi:hypothetical protein